MIVKHSSQKKKKKEKKRGRVKVKYSEHDANIIFLRLKKLPYFLLKRRMICGIQCNRKYTCEQTRHHYYL